ncbi:MAG: DUF1893 domain-containing protein [Armatimonadota bacterium]|nr:DUF1893 domain-containing protein [Armatimonadota bacterium]
MAAGIDVCSDLDLATDRLRQAGLAFVMVSEGRVVAESAATGLADLLQAARGLREAACAGVVLADRVVGIAALLVACWAGIRAIHAEVASDTAHRQACARGVTLRSERRVPFVMNRQGNGPCPFESIVSRALEQRLELPEAISLVEGLAMSTRASGPCPACEKGAARADVVAGAGLGLALAILLPMVFHTLGLGPAFLPMHIPVLLTGALFGAGVGLVVGAAAPLFSAVLTGMPPLSPPVAQLMTVELATYGAVAGWLRIRLARRRLQRPSAIPRLPGHLATEYAWLLCALVAGRVALGLAAAALGPVFGLPVSPAAYVHAAILTGLPGLTLQIAVVPFLTWKLADGLKIRPERGERHGTVDAS